MARRKTSLVDDLLDIASMLPWWLDISIAILSYFGLHGLSLTEIPVVTESGKVSDLLTAQLIKTFASIAQYILPFIFTLGAFISFFRRKKRETLLNATKQRGKQSALLEMSWREFEMLIGEVFRKRGFVANKGISLASEPELANYFASLARDSVQGRADIAANPVVYPLLHRVSKGGTINLDDGLLDKEVTGAVLDAWDAGYDVLKMSNYRFPGKKIHTHNYLVRDPSQIRSRFAAFDPAKKNSANILASLLAGTAIAKNNKKEAD